MRLSISHPNHFSVRLGQRLHCTFNAATVQSQHHRRHPMSTAAADVSKRINPTITQAQAQELATADGPSVPEILQSKGRRVRVNYIRRDNEYNVNI